MSTHRVVLKALVTADVDAGSPDEARRIALDALADAELTVTRGFDEFTIHIGSPEIVSVAGDGEDPASDE